MRWPWIYRKAANPYIGFQRQAQSNGWEQCRFYGQKEFREVRWRIGPKRWPLTTQYRLGVEDMADRRLYELTSAKQEAAYDLYFTEEESTC